MRSSHCRSFHQTIFFGCRSTAASKWLKVEAQGSEGALGRAHFGPETAATWHHAQ
jgi:hypothetical protein